MSNAGRVLIAVLVSLVAGHLAGPANSTRCYPR